MRIVEQEVQRQEGKRSEDRSCLPSILFWRFSSSCINYHLRFRVVTVRCFRLLVGFLPLDFIIAGISLFSHVCIYHLATSDCSGAGTESTPAS